jgi:hypothetical protein
MASKIARGVALIVASLAVVGGAFVAWHWQGSARSGAASHVDAGAAADAGAVSVVVASSSAAVAPLAQDTGDASVDVDRRIESFKRRFGASLVVRGEGGWAVVKSPTSIALIARSASFGWCRQSKPTNALTVDTPPVEDGDGGLPRYRNPSDLSRFTLNDGQLATGNEGDACPERPHEYLTLDEVCPSARCNQLTELRGKGIAPKSLVLKGAFCREHARSTGDASLVLSWQRLFVCDRVALVYDLIDDAWVKVDDPPERPDQIQSLKNNERPVFARTLVYFTTVDIAHPETAVDPRAQVIDAHGFESWDGQRWSMAAPGLRRVYTKAYETFENKAYHLQEELSLHCSEGALEALAKATVAGYVRNDHPVDKHPLAELNQIETLLSEMLPDCFSDDNPRNGEFIRRYHDMFSVLAKAPVPPP